MPPPPPPANVYPCIDWIPKGIARNKPKRLKLTNDELKNVISAAKSKALEARKRLGQAVREEQMVSSQGSTQGAPVNQASNEPRAEDEDDIIMKEYGLDSYDDEDKAMGNENDASEDDADEGLTTSTRGPTSALADDIAGLTYHASNEDDPYLRQAENGAENDDQEEEDELIIKPTDNLIVAGHVSKDESSIEVYVYDVTQNDLYLHHDIIQSDYPCCVKWIGHVHNKTKNLAAAGYMSPDIYLWDLDIVDVLEPLEILKGHRDAVIDISWNDQVRNIMASGSADKHVRLWNLDECKSVSNIKLSGKVSALEFGIYEKFLLLGGDLNKNVSLIDTRTNSVVCKWQLTGEVEKVRWAPASPSNFLVSDDQGYIYYYDIRQSGSNNQQPQVKFHAHQISVTGLEFSPKCSDMLVTASADDTIKVWDTKEAFSSTRNSPPKLVKEITDLKVGSILSLKICPDSLAMIAVGGDNKCNSFKTYDLTNEKEGKLMNTQIKFCLSLTILILNVHSSQPFLILNHTKNS